MNYLAHAWLSFGRPDILAGNMFSDFIKGKQKLLYGEGIQNGILLHRAIDQFTDAHPVTQEAKQLFRPYYRLYAGAFIDVVYDHFLARDAGEFGPGELSEFAEWTYTTLDAYQLQMPDRFRQLFPYMRSQNWLLGYAEKEGIGHSFRGLVRRAAYMQNAEPAYELFLEHYDLLQTQYDRFFPELKIFADERLQLISRKM
jgi:acyl carrier protein phosphodiesterase